MLVFSIIVYSRVTRYHVFEVIVKKSLPIGRMNTYRIFIFPRLNIIQVRKENNLTQFTITKSMNKDG